jgi:hypothetical protein
MWDGASRRQVVQEVHERYDHGGPMTLASTVRQPAGGRRDNERRPSPATVSAPVGACMPDSARHERGRTSARGERPSVVDLPLTGALDPAWTDSSRSGSQLCKLGPPLACLDFRQREPPLQASRSTRACLRYRG